MTYAGDGTNMYGLRADQLYEIQAAFHRFDANHNGYISLDEMRQCLHLCNVFINDFDIYRVFSQMDYNQDGQVSYDEYMKFLSRLYRGERP